MTLWVHSFVECFLLGLVGSASYAALNYLLSRDNYKKWHRLGLLHAFDAVSKQRRWLVDTQEFGPAMWADFYLAAILVEYIRDSPDSERQEMFDICTPETARLAKQWIAEIEASKEGKPHD